MIWRSLSRLASWVDWILYCSHDEQIREIAPDGSLWLYCTSCGRRVEIVKHGNVVPFAKRQRMPERSGSDAA